MVPGKCVTSDIYLYIALCYFAPGKLDIAIAHLYKTVKRDNGKVSATNFVSCLTIPVIPYHSLPHTDSRPTKKKTDGWNKNMFSITSHLFCFIYLHRKTGRRKRKRWRKRKMKHLPSITICDRYSGWYVHTLSFWIFVMFPLHFMIWISRGESAVVNGVTSRCNWKFNIDIQI